MARTKSVFVCQYCGYESPRWMGRCPGCDEWNTMTEELISKKAPQGKSNGRRTDNRLVAMDRVDLSKERRINTGIRELDRVLGGGIVRGSLVLVGGDPGIGKSTLLLQLAGSISSEQRVLYVSGEESVMQIKLRAERLGINSGNILLLGETDIDSVLEQVRGSAPDMLIVDSIQTMYTSEISSAPGSVTQVREVTGRLLRLAKTVSVPIFIIGHVTKQGSIAGPRVLEHMVDTVLYFEGERYHSYRVIRSVKNRFGSTNEIGVFEMKGKGLAEVPNPSEFMLEGRTRGVPGTVVVCSMEGTRPMLMEVQALVSFSNLGMPRRMATGIDYNRLSMLMAVMEKRLGMQVQGYDAFVNVVGGLKIDEPAADLGIVTAVASSFKGVPVHKGTVVIGEVGLTGEVRAINSVDRRVAEAVKLGFEHCIVPKNNLKQVGKSAAKITGVPSLAEALDAALGNY